MKKAAAWALCALWMAVIFFMSATPGDVSGAQSGTVTQIILRAVERVAGEEAARGIDAEALETVVRKLAHMGEYAVLFLLLRRALALSGSRRPGLTALAICAAYAAGDEFHQRFTPGRGPSPADVVIDTAGAMMGWGLQSAWFVFFSPKTHS